MKIFTPAYKALALFVFLLSSLAASAYDLVVAKDGSGDYTTVQAAINAAPTGRTTAYTIYIKNGKYKEKISVPSNKPFLQFIGESVANVILTFDDYSGKPMPGGGTFGTSNSASVTINATDFAAINITFENTTGESPQALAINVNADRAAFKNCRFLGGQDTVLTNAAGRSNYFKNCYIDGTVDFIFGNARAVFDSCVIYAKTRSSAGASYITAANTQQAEPYGYVFRDCKIPMNRGGSIYFLGRPWQNDASTADVAKSWNKVIFLNTTMTASVQPAGWSTWDAGTDVTKITYAEYKSKKFDGSLVDISQRVPWSKQLTDAESLPYYSNSTLFGTWNPCNVTPDFCTYAPAPIAIANFKGVKGTSTTSFNWNISWPIAQVKYEVLRSTDKINFTSVNEQTVTNDSVVNFSYSETIPPPGVTWHYLVRASKAGYDTNISSDTVSISSTPTISVAGILGSFIQGIGTPSTSQSYTVSGSSLTSNLQVSVAFPYELSANNGTTWLGNGTVLNLAPDALGNVLSTNISVRLNGTAVGSYPANVLHTSVGATGATVPLTGTIQADPLTVTETLQYWPLLVGGGDSAAVRSPGAVASAPTFKNLYLSNGTTVPAVTAYSTVFGQGFGASSNGDGSWVTGAPTSGPGGNLNRAYYEQFTVTATATHSLRVDSLLLTTSFYNTSSNTKLAVVYSKTGFTTADSTNVSGGIGPDGAQLPATANGAFTTPLLIVNETAGTTTGYRLAFAGGTGIMLAAGETLTFRLYYSCGSGSAGRYAKLKNVVVKGLAMQNPVTGDYRSHQSGTWTDVNSWERWDGTTWVTPAPTFPHFSNAGVTTILNGHTITYAATITEGFGYIRRTKINIGGQLIVSSGANLNIANDGAPSTATTDLQVDGALTLQGAMFTNGNVSLVVNGTFLNSGTNMNLNNNGDSVFVGEKGVWQHNVNNGNTPTRMIWAPTSKFLITGITTNQTGIFKNNIRYGNIEWNNPGQTAYYAFRNTLDSANVQGGFTLFSTGSSNITFVNASGRVKFPGAFVQRGGTINFRESGNIIDTLEVGGNFELANNIFNANVAAGSSLLIKLTGTQSTMGFNQPIANTNWQITGNYRVGTPIILPTAGFGMTVTGSLSLDSYSMSGAGDFTVQPGATLISGALNGFGPAVSGNSGNLNMTGIISLSTAANYTYDGLGAQFTGLLAPDTLNTLRLINLLSVTLSKSINSSKTLLFNSPGSFYSSLVLGNYNMVTDTVINSDNTRYVATTGTGILKINKVGASPRLFPIGTAALPFNSTQFFYSPVTITNTGTVDNFAVRVKATFDNPVPNANTVVNRQWTIAEDVPGGSTSTLSFSWVAADQAPGFNPGGAVVILQYNGTTWLQVPAVVTGSGTTANPFVATASGFTSFSTFAVSNAISLPVTLLQFNAGYVNNNLNIWWSTAKEINTAYFEVEKSADGRTFSQLVKVNATGSGDNHYNAVDANAFNGVSYYRLKMYDRDGSFKYSQVVAVNSKLKGFAVYPNPVASMLIVTHEKTSANTLLEVIAADGKKLIVQKAVVNATQSSLNVSQLAAGKYYIVLKDGDVQSSRSFIKK